MTRQDILIRKMSQGYKNAIIKSLQLARGTDLMEAMKLFQRYYRPVKKAWGHEPNAEEFAKHILRLDRWANNRLPAGHGVSIAHIRPRPNDRVKVVYSARTKTYVPCVIMKKRRALPILQNAFHDHKE